MASLTDGFRLSLRPTIIKIEFFAKCMEIVFKEVMKMRVRLVGKGSQRINKMMRCDTLDCDLFA